MSDLKDTSQNIHFDVVIPNGNEADFIERALALGYKEIVFLTTNSRYIKPKSDTVLIKTAYLSNNPSDIPKLKRNFDYIFAKAERKFFEQKIDFIIDSELSDRKDSFHYKATSLNQVHADLAKKNCTNIVFSFSNLLVSPMIVFGRMCQNAVLVKKYRLDYSVFSLALKPSDMRSRNVLDALSAVLLL
jgi:hypothetical protein